MSEETTTTEAPATEAQGETTSETNPTVSYADGKFNNVGDLEKSYLELQSTFSKKLGGFEGAPEEYKFNQEGFEQNEMSEALAAWGKENQLSNDGLNSLYEQMSEIDANKQKSYEEAEANYIKEQTELLGVNADARIKNVTDWVNANGGEGASDKLNLMAAGADGLAIIENIMKASQGNTPAPVQAQEHVTLEKINAMQHAKDEYGQLKMDDPVYAAKVRALREQNMRNR